MFDAPNQTQDVPTPPRRVTLIELQQSSHIKQAEPPFASRLGRRHSDTALFAVMIFAMNRSKSTALNHSSGVFDPFIPLQGRQPGTTLLAVVPPPRLIGTT